MLLASLLLLVVQAPTQVLRIAEPPAVPFIAHGIVPVRTAPDAARITTSSPQGEQVQVLLAGPVWTLLRVAAPVPAGTQTLEIRPGPTRNQAPLAIPTELLAFAHRPTLRLVVVGHHGDYEQVDLGQGRAWTKGPWRVGFTGTAHTQRYGTFRWWTTANGGTTDRRCWITLRWTNAVTAAGAARPEFLFRSVRIEGLPSSVAWTTDPLDPAVAPGFLVKPLDHVFPQRGVRDFRLVVHLPAFAPARSSDGWACADWSAGGWLPAGLAIPALEGAGRATRARAANELAAFSGFRGTGGATEAPRCSWLWPYAGVPYGGMTGEIDIWPYDGCLTASSGAREGLQMHRALALRYGCRQLLGWEPDGTPLDPARHLTANGEAPWNTYDFVFLRQYGAAGGTSDAPWEFDQVPKPAGPRAYTLEASGVAPIDFQHLVRAVKDARALVWLDGDPSAAEYLVNVAEHARMTFWTGPGRARRLIPPAVPGKAWEVGRAEAWSGSTVAVAAMLGRPRMREWAQVLVDGCTRAVTPCGLFAGMSAGKAATTPPMDGRFVVQRGNELAYFAGLFREFQAGLGLELEPLLEAGRRGTSGMAWAPGSGGGWDRHVLGTADRQTWYVDRTEVPDGVYDPAVLERWTYYAGNLVGSFDLPALAAEWRAAVEYGVGTFREREGSITVRDGAPIEVWLPALARWGLGE